MPIKHMISPGIGFSPGKVQYIVTRGLSIGAVVDIPVLAVIAIFAADESVPIISGDDTIPSRSSK